MPTSAIELAQRAVRADLAQLQRNLSDNHCPLPVKEAWVAPLDRARFPGCGAVQVFLVMDHPRRTAGDERLNVEPAVYRGLFSGKMSSSEDMDVLQDLATPIESTGACSPLVQVSPPDSEIMDRLGDPITPDEISRMIDFVVKTQWDTDLFKDDGVAATRLKKLYAAWLGGSPWGHTFIHAGYRPSMASWDGYAYEEQYIMRNRQCGLTSDLSEFNLVEVAGEIDKGADVKGGLKLWESRFVHPSEPGGVRSVASTSFDISEELLSGASAARGRKAAGTQNAGKRAQKKKASAAKPGTAATKQKTKKRKGSGAAAAAAKGKPTKKKPKKKTTMKP